MDWQTTRKGLWPLAALAACLATAGAARANAEVYQRALAASGWVVVLGKERTSSGTCWLADRERRLAVTCRHVVGTAREVLIYFPRHDKDGELIVEASHYLNKVPAVRGRVVASDRRRDLALIQLQSLPAGVQALPLAPRSSRPGEDVHSVGNSGLTGRIAEGSLWWYTRGNVRQVHTKKLRLARGVRVVRMVETQAPVNEGDSGGPVVNDRGELVGVTDSYTAGRRLVSQNIDVREVKDFVAESLAGLAKAGAWTRPGVLGGWRFRATGKDGRAVRGRAEFKEDGTFQLSGLRPPRSGRYALANGVLWLIFDDNPSSAPLTWSGKDRFTLRFGDADLAFVRQRSSSRPARRAATTLPARRPPARADK
jgi:hypothetical protein